jgi:hypothetical protein
MRPLMVGALRTLVEERGEGGLRIAVDVSSLSRYRTAVVIEEVFELGRRMPVELVVVYSPARFAEAEPVSPMAILQPVTSTLDGGVADPELPLVAVIGVGYEDERGLGVLDFLDASEAWVLVPFGFKEEFDLAIEEANGVLLGRLNGRRINYPPARPTDALRTLTSLCHSLRSEYRVVVVPMGPKILSACAVLVSLMANGVDAVWRGSSGPLDAVRLVEAEGPVVGLKVASDNVGSC